MRGRYRACLLAGAAGDALGWPVEFLSLAEIRTRYGPDGIQHLPDPPHVTDDTQMTLFTAEGLLEAHRAGADDPVPYVRVAYLRWARTQRGSVHLGPEDDGLIRDARLLAQRAPGMTCLAALGQGGGGTVAHPINDSKGCGGIMRVAPVGLLYDAERAFEIGCASAALTHGHPSGYLASGVFAAMIALLLDGATLDEAEAEARALVRNQPGAEETLNALWHARNAKTWTPKADNVAWLGEGWVAEESLAIALYAAWHADGNLVRGLRLAANHGGDSDSTASLTGQILGAMGADVPADWRHVELADLVLGMADTLFDAASIASPEGNGG